MHRYLRRSLLALPGVLTLAFAVSSVEAQNSASSHDPDAKFIERKEERIQRRANWLVSQDRSSHFNAIRNLIVAERRQLGFGEVLTHYDSLVITQRAQDVAAIYTLREVEDLRTKQMDPIRPYFKTEFTTQGVYNSADNLVVGEIVKIITPATNGDGYNTTLHIRVHEVLKGHVSDSIIWLRQVSGLRDDSGWQSSTADLLEARGAKFIGPSKGTKFVLPVSHKLYGLRVAMEGNVPATGPKYYVLQSPVYILEQENLQPYRGILGSERPTTPRTLSDFRQAGRRGAAQDQD